MDAEVWCVVRRFCGIAGVVLAGFVGVARRQRPVMSLASAGESYHSNSYGTGHSQTTKMTWPATDPVAVASFWLGFLPTTPWLVGNESWVDSNCATYGKVFVGNMSDAAFQLHAVSAPLRPDGGVSVAAFEAAFSQAAQAAIAEGIQAAALDYNVALYADDLSYFASRLDCGGVRYLSASWPLDGGLAYSLIIPVPNSLVVVELVSLRQSDVAPPTVRWTLPRATSLPPDRHEVGATFRSMPALTAFRISYPTAELDAATSFYTKVLGADEILDVGVDGRRVVAFKFPRDSASRIVEVHYVYHPSAARWERDWRAAHLATTHNDSAGFDQWMDAHYGHRLGRVGRTALPDVANEAKALNLSYTYFADYSSSSASWTTFLYLLAPGGTAIQLVGNLSFADWPARMRIFDTCADLGGTVFVDRATVERLENNGTNDKNYRLHPNYDALANKILSDQAWIDTCMASQHIPSH
ncbi:hypothetical protein CTAYLR_001491 [Chrysophaeum taylorii]|uniref:VOC domain-containing protein n=1 Tax=Chrysophaeum taylorii TaxID=2483200 RepID=A0AAD7UE52_9STRA|nr:hypothetical protein CTAYLR_001491 [Chrysophaeum taylorii]